jgi:four helix bundle protein
LKENVIEDKSYRFALRAVKLYKFLIKEHHEFFLSRQILRSGTSIGANVEAIGGVSKKEFINKLSIAYKEARETHYWLRIIA